MRRRHRNARRGQIPGQKLRGCFQERVKMVGPEHFAIIPVDCGKPEACTRVADFYGNVLLGPFSFEISKSGLRNACTLIKQTLREHRIKDCVCAIETTGRYHIPIRKTFKEQAWDTREVHPFTSTLYRRAADLGTKTDPIDLEAIHRAAVNGLAMQPEVLDETHQQWRLMTRYRRDLVEKAATLKVQLKEVMHAYLPGYTSLWSDDNFWESPVGVTIATTFASPLAMLRAQDDEYRQVVRIAGSIIQKPTIHRIRAWARDAAPEDEASPIHYRRACSLWHDLRGKQQEIRVLELELANFLCNSNCVLLLAFPGVHVISASDYGAELGPITNYATSKSICGRAGLYPSRYQSAETDHANGPLVARRNRQLRAALMRLGRNLARSNTYFMSAAHAYEKRQPDGSGKVVVARMFSRLSYYIIASGQLITHPSLQHSEKVLQKLLEFFQERHAESEQVTSCLGNAIDHLSGRTLQNERAILNEQHQRQLQKRRRGGLHLLSELLPEVLLRIDKRLEHIDVTEAETTVHNNSRI